MRSASECRERAKECRALAKNMTGERRLEILSMAEAWEGLAREVDRVNSRHISDMLKAAYGKVAEEPVPDKFRDLLGQLEHAESRSARETR